MPKLKPNTVVPTDNEDRSITEAAMSDLDNQPLDDAFFAKAKPYRLGRPRAEVTKRSTTVRLDPEVIEYFKAEGQGWQSRLNAALVEYVHRRKAGRV